MLCQVVDGFQQGFFHPNTNYFVLDLVILFQILWRLATDLVKTKSAPKYLLVVLQIGYLKMYY